GRRVTRSPGGAAAGPRPAPLAGRPGSRRAALGGSRRGAPPAYRRALPRPAERPQEGLPGAQARGPLIPGRPRRGFPGAPDAGTSLGNDFARAARALLRARVSGTPALGLRLRPRGVGRASATPARADRTVDAALLPVWLDPGR